MRSLVTGASGFLGSAVMNCLLNAGHEVRVLIRPESNRRNLENLPIQISEGDLRDTVSLKHAVAGCDYLFHVAADYRFWVPDPKTMYDINVIGTQDLVRIAMEAGVTRIVYTSSVATLGINHDGTPANEKTIASLRTVSGHYKRSKFLAEQVVQQLTHTYNLPVIIVNPSTPIGPRDIRPTPTGRMVLDTILGKMPAYINTGLNIAHVDDIAHGHLLALKHGKIGERYILGGENMTLLQILQTIDNFTGRHVNRLKLPVKLMLPIAWLMERIASATNREPRATVDSIRMASKMMFFSSDKAKLDLGYRYRPAIEALEDAVIWFKENGYCN